MMEEAVWKPQESALVRANILTLSDHCYLMRERKLGISETVKAKKIVNV